MRTNQNKITRGSVYPHVVHPRVGRRAGAVLGAAVLASCALDASATVNVPATWLSALSGSWGDTSKWSAGVVPNNGADSYSVTVGATGPAYTVSLNGTGTTTINNLTLNSPSATLAVSNGTFTVANSAINLAAGTLQLNSGTLSNSIVTYAGGSLAFGATPRFNNVTVNG